MMLCLSELREGNGFMSGIHGFDFRSVSVVDNRASDFQCVCQFSCLHGELFGQQSEFLDLLEVGEISLNPVNALLKHLADVGVAYEFLDVAILNVFFTGIFLECFERRNDYSRDIFALVADYRNLIDVFVFTETAFKSLGSDIFAIGSLEEVFYAFGKYQCAGLVEASGISRAEPSDRKSVV